MVRKPTLAKTPEEGRGDGGHPMQALAILNGPGKPEHTSREEDGACDVRVRKFKVWGGSVGGQQEQGVTYQHWQAAI